MNEYLAVCSVALVASALTLYSGFGLGTLLLPVFAVFFDTGVAVAITAVVHFCNNLAKLLLVGRHADRSVVVRFGVPAFLASFAGAWLLKSLAGGAALHEYRLFGVAHEVTAIGLVIGVLIAVFAWWESARVTSRLAFSPRLVPVGGVLSGFFGGLSGHQGALRSAFLLRLGLAREAFIGSGVVIACLVDFARIGSYAGTGSLAAVRSEWRLAAAAVVCAIAGAVLAARHLHAVPMSVIRGVVTAMLYAIALAIGAGLV